MHPILSQEEVIFLLDKYKSLGLTSQQAEQQLKTTLSHLKQEHGIEIMLGKLIS